LSLSSLSGTLTRKFVEENIGVVIMRKNKRALAIALIVLLIGFLPCGPDDILLIFLLKWILKLSWINAVILGTILSVIMGLIYAVLRKRRR